jgi:hypothetical protein
MPDERTCLEAHVPDAFCPCIKELPVSIAEGIQPAITLLNYLNQIAHTYKEFSPPDTRCSRLELDLIKEVSVLMAPSKVLVDPSVDDQPAKDVELR